jgi:hypothetical protein
MAKAVEVADATHAARFAAVLALPEYETSRGSLACVMKYSSRNFWAILRYLYNDAHWTIFTAGRLRGAVAWLRESEDLTMTFRPIDIPHVSPLDPRPTMLRWMNERCDAETIAWVLERERRGLVAARAREAVAAAAAIIDRGPRPGL